MEVKMPAAVSDASTDVELQSMLDLEKDKDSLPPEREGGWHAWLTVAGSALVYFCCIGNINSFGFFQKFYESDFLAASPASTIAFIGTLQIALMNLFSSISGTLFDSFGLKYLYLASGIATSGALVALSFARPGQLWEPFLIQGGILGLAAALGSQPAISVVGQHFREKQALVMGIVAAGGSVGGVCFPLIFNQLVPWIGFAWSLRMVAVVSAGCFVLAYCVSWTKYPTKTWKQHGPLLDFGGFRDPRYSLLAAGDFIGSLGIFVPFYFIETYMEVTNPESNMKGNLLPLLNATSIIGRIGGGLAADKLGRVNLLFSMTLLAGISCLCMWLVSASLPVLIIFACVYGFCSGVFTAVVPAAIGQISPEEKIGGRIGTFYSLIAVATLIGSPVGGALISANTQKGYSRVISFAGLTIIAGGILFFASRLYHDKSLRRRW